MFFCTFLTLVLTISLPSVNSQPKTKLCSDQIRLEKCLDQGSCTDCLLVDPCCHWCYSESFANRRCDLFDNLQANGCNDTFIEKNWPSQTDILDNRKFNDVSANSNDHNVVQIKPQRVEIRARKNVPQNFTFHYKPAKNYHLDLYYLLDMSVSMKDSLQTIKQLGKDLSDNLSALTENYRLAFGSFSDKPRMPFYLTAPEVRDNPCKNLRGKCERGYLYRHVLNFTRDTTRFAQTVGDSDVTANSDDLDGGLDALYQVLVCRRRLDWLENSRKIVLLATDSLLHAAGDGILAGAVSKLKRECLLDEHGLHGEPFKYDYPSLAEIDRLLRDTKVNVIFAVKDNEKQQVYKLLNQQLNLARNSSFLGILEERSTNILDLIKKGFYNFSTRVNFYVNTTEHEDLKVRIFADCDRNGVYEEVSSCYGVVEGEEIPFSVQVTLTSDPRKEEDLIYVEETNINEKIEINVRYAEFCKCQNFKGVATKCVEGSFQCGMCKCPEGRTGDTCEELCQNNNACKFKDYICNKHGSCDCGKCKCDFPFAGNQCEYKCPIKDWQICNGQGSCEEGKCTCHNGFSEDDCSCSPSQHKCKAENDAELCNGSGECVCNSCKCESDFAGDYCQLFKKDEGICEDTEEFVEKFMMNGTAKFTYLGSEINSVKEFREEKDFEEVCGSNEDVCHTRTFKGNVTCPTFYCYRRNATGSLKQLNIMRQCVTTASLKLPLIILGLLIPLLIGLSVIAFMKLKIWREEKAEYKRFEEMHKNSHNMNPIYKSPVVQYENPMARTKHD